MLMSQCLNTGNVMLSISNAILKKKRLGRMHFATDLTQDLVSKNERFKCKKYLLEVVVQCVFYKVSLFHIIDRFLAADIHD